MTRWLQILAAEAAAVGLTCGSSAYQRRGPELIVVGNVCGPQVNELCYAPVLKGGSRSPYIYDSPGVSVEGKLALGEDKVRPAAFAVDVLAYFVVVLVTGKALVHLRPSRRTARPAHVPRRVPGSTAGGPSWSATRDDLRRLGWVLGLMWLALAAFTTLAQRFLGWRLAAGLIGGAGALFTLGLLLVATGSLVATSLERRWAAHREGVENDAADGPH